MDIQALKKQAELLRVQAAKAEMDFQIAERMAEIDRLKANIQIQLNKETELKGEIQKLRE